MVIETEGIIHFRSNLPSLLSSLHSKCMESRFGWLPSNPNLHRHSHSVEWVTLLDGYDVRGVRKEISQLLELSFLAKMYTLDGGRVFIFATEGKHPHSPFLPIFRAQPTNSPILAYFLHTACSSSSPLETFPGRSLNSNKRSLRLTAICCSLSGRTLKDFTFSFLGWHKTFIGVLNSLSPPYDNGYTEDYPKRWNGSPEFKAEI